MTYPVKANPEIKSTFSLQLFKGKLKNPSRTFCHIQFEKEACLINSKNPDVFIFKIFVLGLQYPDLSYQKAYVCMWPKNMWKHIPHLM